jgi:hypothetical protein
MGYHVFRAVFRARLAAVAAGVTVAVLGLAGTATAGAATSASRAGIPIVYTKGTAGYWDGHGIATLFRFVGATVPVAACQPASIIPKKADNANAMIALLGAAAPQEAELAVSCGGGSGSITYFDNGTNGVINLAPSVGDVLRISVYREVKALKDQYTVTDTTTGVTRQLTISTATHGVTFHYAELGSVINNAGIASRPVLTTRLWVFKDCNVTTYGGVHGTILGPWPTYRFWDTTDGTASGASVMYPTYPSDNGSHFGTWLVSSH